MSQPWNAKRAWIMKLLKRLAVYLILTFWPFMPRRAKLWSLKYDLYD